MTSGIRLKSHVTYEHQQVKRATAALRKMYKAVKKGKMLKGPAPRRLRIKA